MGPPDTERDFDGSRIGPATQSDTDAAANPRPIAPRVSVVIPTFRRPTFLARAITSVLAQTFGSWEVLVIDDNDPLSSHREETAALMRPYADDPRVRYVEHSTNRGGSAARNTGTREARGSLVAFLDDDDEWHPTKLERQVSSLDDAWNEVAMAYCRTRVVLDDGQGFVPQRTDGVSHGVRDLLKRNTIGSTSCIVCRRDALLAVGGFDETLPSKQDIDLYVRLAERFSFAFVDAVLVTVHQHAQERVSHGLSSSIIAHERFHAKHWHEIVRYPEVLHHRLVSLGTIYLWAGRRSDARTALWRAWRLRPLDGTTIRRLALAHGDPRGLVRAAGQVFRGLARREVGSTTPKDRT